MERDLSNVRKVSVGNNISTHTLTWSVTLCMINPFIFWIFQLTRSRGAWLRTLASHFIIFIFQLTRSRGAWQFIILHCVSFVLNFNSHAHVERDMKTSNQLAKYREFQLTRSRGAWLGRFSVTEMKTGFQLTRSRGAWQWAQKPISRLWSFQLTRSRGAWRIL